MEARWLDLTSFAGRYVALDLDTDEVLAERGDDAGNASTSSVSVD